MKSRTKLPAVALFLSCSPILLLTGAAATLEGSQFIIPNGSDPGDLDVAGSISFGTAANPVFPAARISMGTSNSVYWELTDPSGAFVWRDNSGQTPRNKMHLGAGNVLTLYKNDGSSGLVLDPTSGSITVGASPVVTTQSMSSALSGLGLQISNGNLSIPSTSGSALNVTGGVVIGKDSSINGVTLGRGSGASVSNTALGLASLGTTNSGSGLTAVGALTLARNTTGTNNTAVGAWALELNTTGGNNTALGAHTLRYLASGGANVAVGSQALLSLTSGNSNSALGYGALYHNISGSSNVAFGQSAGRYVGSGTSPLSNPADSVYIGSNTRGWSANESNAIVIGANSIGGGANSTVIGNSQTVSTRLYGALTAGNGAQAGASALAIGTSAQAPYDGAIALGNYSQALNVNSTAIQGSVAQGVCSFAASVGYSPADYSTSILGWATGECSVAIGGLDESIWWPNEAYGIGSTSIGGVTNLAGGDYSYAMGWNSQALGRHSYSIGYRTHTNGYAVSMGSQNLSANGSMPNMENESWAENGALFELGNGKPNDQGGNNDYSNAITTLKNGQTTLTNKEWKANTGNPLADPTPTTDSGGEALVVEGHTRLKGKVVIEQPQGDISMGIYQ